MTQIYDDMQELVVVDHADVKYLCKIQENPASAILRTTLVIRSYYTPLATLVRWIMGHLNGDLTTESISTPYIVTEIPRAIKNRTLVDLGSDVAYSAEGLRLSVAVAYYKQINYELG